MKSSLNFSTSNCVEVASLHDNEIGVRDSKDSEGPVLRFTPPNGMHFSEVCATENSIVPGGYAGYGKVP
jgi:hypothetical protein